MIAKRAPAAAVLPLLPVQEQPGVWAGVWGSVLQGRGGQGGCTGTGAGPPPACAEGEHS